MSGADKYTESAPPLNFDQAFLDAQLKKQPGVGKLQAQILSQNTYDKWTGQGFGSVRNTAKDMAQKLWDAGITRLEDFGQRKVMGPPTMGYDENIGPVEVPGVERYEYYNKATGKPIESGYETGPNTWGGTYRGDGSTAYHVQFTESGMPIFYAGYGGSSSDWGTVSQILSFASFIPGIGPFAAALNAVGQAYNGNYTGAVLSALSAGAGYYGSELQAAQGADAAQAAQAAESLGVTVEQLQAAGYAAQSGNTAELAKIFGGIRTAQQATSVLMALDQKNLAGVINGLVSMAPQIGITIPEEVMKPIQVASIGAAVSRGDLAGALQSASTLTGNSDLTLASKGAYLANAIKSGNPVSILSGFIDFQKTSETLSVKSFQDAAKAIGLPMSTEEATKIVNSPDYKKDVSLYNSTVKKAQEAYAKETGGGQLPPEFFEQHNIADLIKAADDLYTTPAEAKSLWAKELGYTPSEFDLMELEGLATSDVRAIIDDKATFDSNELAEAYKAVYGREPTDEWLASDEAMDMLGRSERQGNTLLQNSYAKDKDWVAEDEAEQIWRSTGNTGPIPQEFMDRMLMTSESGARAMAETYRITSEDRAATTFDGSGYETAEKARAAAIGAGYNSFTDPNTGKTQIILPEDENYKRSQLVRQVLDAQGLTPSSATTEQRRQAIDLVSSVAQDKLDGTNVVDLMADAGIAGGSYVKQESNLKYYLTAPPSPSAPKAFDGTKYSTQTDAAIAAASRGQDTFAWTDGKTYKVPPQIAEDGKSGALRDKSFANDLVSLANAYDRGEISNKEYKFLEAGVKKQTEAVNKLVTNRDLKSAQEAAGLTVGWANLGVETKETISMLDRAADRALSLGEGVGSFIAHIGQTIAALTVDTNPTLTSDPETGILVSSPTGAPKMWMDPNNNIITNFGRDDVSAFFTSRYSDQAKDERKKITDEIKRPGATEASVAAVVLNNLHGYSTFTGAELAEEVIPYLAGGGVGAILKLGKAGLVAITGSAATIADMSEVYGPTYAKVQKESLDRGDDAATAHALASRAASGNALITLATEGPLNFMLAKGLLIGSVKNAAYTVGGNMAAQMAGEYVEAMAHNINEDYVLTGKTPVLEDLNKYRGQATFEALVAGGTTSSMYVLAAANPSKVIGKDYDGNDFTVADAITKPNQFDTKTLDSSAIVTDPTTGKTGNFLDVFGDATVKYANGYSTEITESVISKNPTQSLEIMQDMGLANWNSKGEITFSPEAGNIATAFISSNTVLPQVNGAYAPTFDFSDLSGVEVFSNADATALFKEKGISNPTPEQLARFTGVGSVSQKRKDLAAYADKQTTSEAEARLFFKANGITNPTPEQLAMFVGEKPDAQQRAAVNAYADPLATTESEARAFFRDIGITDPTDDQLSQYVGARPESDMAAEIQRMFGTKPADTATGTDGEDTITGTDGEDTTTGTEVTDTITGTDGTDTTTGTDGTDTTTGSDGTDTTTGTDGADTVTDTNGTDITGDTDQLTQQDITDIVNGALKANPSITEAQVQAIINEALAADDSVTAEEVQSIVDSAVSSIPAGLTESAVQKIVGDAIAANPSLTETQVQKIVGDAMTANPGITASEVANIVNTAVSAIPAGVTESAVQQIVSDALAANPSLTESQVQTIVNDALAANPGISAADVKGIVDSAVAAATEGTSGQISELEAQTKAQYESLTAAQKAAADALVLQGQTLQDAIAAAKTETAGQIAGVETRLTDAIAAAEAMGLSRDQAITAAIGSVAAELGTTKDALLGQLGTTEAALRSEFAAGLSNLGTQTQAQYDSLTAAQKATADALVAQGQSMQQAVATVQGQITDLATQTQAAFDTLTADQKALVDALTQQGVDLSTAITTVQSQVTDLATTTQKQYETLTAAQKAIVDTLTQQGADLSTAIATAQQQTQTQIAGLTADTQAKFDSLTQSQKDLATQLTQQGVDINTAIAQVQQQTQQQFTGLETRVNELMTQGQTYQQATQTAINELTSQNTQLAGQIGTQGRTASQLDIDTLTQMLGGQRSMDLSYDVTGDRRITQDDIDFLTRVVSGANPDWRPPADSAWGPTGLYGQLAKTEAQRQADLQAQLAREEAARVAEIERQRVAAEEAQRQGKIANIRGALSQGQQAVQSFGQQLPQALKQSQEVTTPLYGTMEYFDPFGDPFAQQKMRTASSTNPADQTKMAAGGYIDDLLAGEMTVDDLLNLLR